MTDIAHFLCRSLIFNCISIHQRRVLHFHRIASYRTIQTGPSFGTRRGRHRVGQHTTLKPPTHIIFSFTPTSAHVQFNRVFCSCHYHNHHHPHHFNRFWLYSHTGKTPGKEHRFSSTTPSSWFLSSSFSFVRSYLLISFVGLLILFIFPFFLNFVNGLNYVRGLYQGRHKEELPGGMGGS